MWAFSMTNMINDDSSSVVDVKEMMSASGKTFLYNPMEAQKNDLCSSNPSSKFILSSTCNEDYSLLESLIFVTSYFFRCSTVRRKRLISIDNSFQITDQVKAKKVWLRHNHQKQQQEHSPSPVSGPGVLFLLGENEKLVQQDQDSKQSDAGGGGFVKKKKDNPLFYRRVSLPKQVNFESSKLQDCPLAYGISISKQVLPGEILQGVIEDHQNVGKIVKIMTKNHLETNELIWIHGNIQDGSTKIHSSLACDQEREMDFAPLVADLVDAIDDQLPPEQVLDAIESSLMKIYLLSKMMGSLISNPRNILSLESLIQILQVDCNDIPLLMAVSSTQSLNIQTSLKLSVSPLAVTTKN